jgi:lipopolysaccharide transport system ATP-binding protein
MSDDIAIKVEGLGKKYSIGGPKGKYLTLRDVISHSLKAPFQWFSNKYSNSSKEEFWALKDVSFDVHKGEIIGIIGRNGAGKSTLLKILSRITTPTEGKVEIHGRIGSLLEVGTGFHPELTGRENIYLSGSLLGMKKQEIEEKFEGIVKFSEIEKFLDTPVKRYSSGMYVRLAFAVAAHMDTEILLIDEVLAVGDAEFQKKCLGKMGDVAKHGRTILFVSHNMNAVEQLCNRCILLENGLLISNDQDVRKIVRKYLFSASSLTNISEWTNNNYENLWFKPFRFYVGNGDRQKSIMPVSNNDDFYVFIEGEVKSLDPSLQIGYAVYEENGNLLYWSCNTDIAEKDWIKLPRGKIVLKSQIPKRFLNQGIYKIEMIVSLYFSQWIIEPGVNSPSIFLSIQGGLSDSPYWLNRRPGILAPELSWTLVEYEG